MFHTVCVFQEKEEHKQDETENKDHNCWRAEKSGLTRCRGIRHVPSSYKRRYYTISINNYNTSFSDFQTCAFVDNVSFSKG